MRTAAGYDLLQAHPELHADVLLIEDQAVRYGVELERATGRRQLSRWDLLWAVVLLLALTWAILPVLGVGPR